MINVTTSYQCDHVAHRHDNYKSHNISIHWPQQRPMWPGEIYSSDILKHNLKLSRFQWPTDWAFRHPCGQKFQQKFGRNSFCLIISFLCVGRKAAFLQKGSILAEIALLGIVKSNLKAKNILQKHLLFTERVSFCRNTLFRFFLYFGKKKVFWETLFRLSAERINLSFGRPLLDLILKGVC